MPRAALYFKLPEEQDEHMSAVNGASYKFCIQDLDEKLRRLMKYEDAQSISIDEVRKMIVELLEQYRLEI